jgi:hypothetical protein
MTVGESEAAAVVATDVAGVSVVGAAAITVVSVDDGAPAFPAEHAVMTRITANTDQRE